MTRNASLWMRKGNETVKVWFKVPEYEWLRQFIFIDNKTTDVNGDAIDFTKGDNSLVLRGFINHLDEIGELGKFLDKVWDSEKNENVKGGYSLEEVKAKFLESDMFINTLIWGGEKQPGLWKLACDNEVSIG